MIMVHNLQAKYSIGSAISTGFRMWHQPLMPTAYNRVANGLAEAFNKTIIKVLKKFVSSSKRDWNEKLSECLWAY